MSKWSRFLLSAILLLQASVSVAAQSAQPKPSSTGELPSRLITASVAADSIRFASLGELVQMRIEVIGASGEMLFDSDFKPGNLIDWGGSDSKGQRLSDGTYLCVVSVKEHSGKIIRRQAIASLRDQSIGLRQSDSSLLSDAQVQAASANADDDSDLIILAPNASIATAVIAHDGRIAHLVSGSGGLSISSGDFFANKLLEHIRLTAEGNLGVGVSDPQTKLDVAGLIRSSQGIVFPDGSIQFSAATKTFGLASLEPGSQQKHAQGQEHPDAPTTGGTGTTGKIPRWLDGPAGVLTDSNIAEAAGAIGINGAPNTNFRLDVNGSTRIRGSNPGFNLEGLRAGGNIWLFQTVDNDGRFRLFGQDNVNPGVERLTISLSTGNVGIGATTPAAKLDVAGDINAATQYNISGARVLSIAGLENAFAGVSAGAANTAGFNSFFGSSAGASNTSGSGNSFFGRAAGKSTTTGGRNTFIGFDAGFSNTIATDNTYVGYQAGAFSGTFAGTSDNSFFGSLAGSVTAAGANSFFGSHAGASTTSACCNAFFGVNAGFSNTTGVGNNAFFGDSAGEANTTGSANAFFGTAAGRTNITGSRITLIGQYTDVGAGDLTNATAIGADAQVTQSNSLVLGSILNVGFATADTNVGIGVTAPQARLHVNGIIRVDVLGASGGSSLCRNGLNQISSCSSSLRYKKEISRFAGGLNIVARLRPIAFTWKDHPERDLGLAAEDVAGVEPLLVTRNANGEIEGVKYDHLSVIFINAIKEQQSQIEQQQLRLGSQQREINQQRGEIEALRRLVCAGHPKARMCSQHRK